MTGNNKDATFPTPHLDEDDNKFSSPSQIEVNFPTLITICDCPLINIVACQDPEVEGKYISGWTCGHCPLLEKNPASA